MLCFIITIVVSDQCHNSLRLCLHLGDRNLCDLAGGVSCRCQIFSSATSIDSIAYMSKTRPAGRMQPSPHHTLLWQPIVTPSVTPISCQCQSKTTPQHSQAPPTANLDLLPFLYTGSQSGWLVHGYAEASAGKPRSLACHCLSMAKQCLKQTLNGCYIFVLAAN